MNFMMITLILLLKYTRLENVKKVSNKKSTSFQPHRFSRVNFLKKKFQSHLNYRQGGIVSVYAAGKKIKNLIK